MEFQKSDRMFSDSSLVIGDKSMDAAEDPGTSHGAAGVREFLSNALEKSKTRGRLLFGMISGTTHIQNPAV